MLSAEQIERRRSGLGATDVVAILGLSEFAGPWEIYLEKTDPTYQRPPAGMPARVGSHMEGLIAELYRERTGRPIFHCDTIEHASHEWALATPDRVVPTLDGWEIDDFYGETVIREGRAERLVEIKRPTIYTAHQWGHELNGAEGVPPRYLVQCQWQLEVCDVEVCDLTALIGDDDLRIYEIRRDRELASALFERSRSFWFDHVVARQPPAVDGSDAARRYVESLFPRPVRPRVRADGELECLARDLRDADAEFKAAEAKREALANEMRRRIGEHEGAWGKGWCASWGEQRGGFDYARAVKEAGVTAERLESYRRPPFRSFRFTWKGENING